MNEYIINTLSNHIDTLKFTDNYLKDICKDYIKVCTTNYYMPITNKYTFIRELKEVLNILQNCNKEDFYWKNLKITILDKMNIRKGLINFSIYLSSTDYFDYELQQEYQIAKINLLKAISTKSWNERNIRAMKYLNSIYITELGKMTDRFQIAFCINISNIIIHDLLCDFIDRNASVLRSNSTFFEVFENSIKDKSKLEKVKTFKDFSIDIFKEQFKFYDNINLSNILCSFYLFLWNFDPSYNLFPKSSGIDYKALKRKGFFKEYKEGYRSVLYNPLDPIPLFDRWIINYNGFDCNWLSVNHGNGISINFELVNTITYRYYIKSWFWKDSSISLKAKIDYFFHIYRFFNFISNKKNDNNLNTISLEETLCYKNYVLSTIDSDTNASKYIYNIRGILRYLKEENFIEMDDNVFYHLRYSSKSENTAKVVPDGDLNKLAIMLEKNAELSDLNKLYYLLFYIILETEFRLSQILSLEIDCVEETAKKGQYVINSKTKTSNGYTLPQSITIYVKKQIDYILKITQDLRNECREEDLKKRLFIKGNYSRKLIISPITSENFAEYLSECCKKLSIPHYNPSNLRDTHITKAKEFTIRNGLSDVEQNTLTGHTSTNTANRHYIESKIADMLELINGTIIGDIDINGNIVAHANESLANKENEVENGCGYCQCNSCKNTSYLSCFMCSDFVATLDRIPYFEEQIKIIDFKLLKVTIQHDKEDLLNIKQLLLNYLKALHLKREEIKNNG
ncbi:tyrosine-type recombinase/integrase [Clostridium sp. JS66]|uniref:tyrosine-type recombinase/integrase n=1 Tax=Clostridium sp. JS66 TaxID=3064705 RepID=UPI00298E8B8B|nr:tyrosine-type recombinase/integrase [Clostridium sp. JS66]WPC42390.1 tyrosine-type recombinase/integrase [Clostridium sp. JS66]